MLSINNSSYNIPHASLYFTLNLRNCGAGIDVRDKHVQGSRKSSKRETYVSPRSSPLRDVSFPSETSFSGDERGETSAVRRLAEVKNNLLGSAVKNTTQFVSRTWREIA